METLTPSSDILEVLRSALHATGSLRSLASQLQTPCAQIFGREIESLEGAVQKILDSITDTGISIIEPCLYDCDALLKLYEQFLKTTTLNQKRHDLDRLWDSPARYAALFELAETSFPRYGPFPPIRPKLTVIVTFSLLRNLPNITISSKKA